MTEKTDIAALRGEVPAISNLFEAGKFIAKVLDQLEAEHQRADKEESHARERDSENESIALTVGRLRLELAKLRGEQEPVGAMVHMMPNVFASLVNTARDAALEYKNAQCLRDALSRELKGYFTLTRQPKPVVVLSDCTFEAVSHMAHWYTEGECVAFVSGVEHAKKQMLAAGIVVKDGE